MRFDRQSVGWVAGLILFAAPAAGQSSAASAARLFDSTRYLADQISITQSRGAAMSTHGVPLEHLRAEYRSCHDALLRTPLDDRIQAALTRLPSPDAAQPAAPVLSNEECSYQAQAIAVGDSALRLLENQMFICYTKETHRIVVDRDTLDRLSALSLLGTTDDPVRRERLFHGLDTVWASVNRHDEVDSPYRMLVSLRRKAWAGRSPLDQRVEALGFEPAQVEGWLESLLDAWSRVLPDRPLEPWDYYYANGAAARQLAARIPRDSLLAINDRFYRSLGADPETLNVHFDIESRVGKYPIAFTNFGDRPVERDGRWLPGEPWVFASYWLGGFDNLNELLHETGHAVHIAAIRAPSGQNDWPDSDIFTEAIAELATLEMYEPAWQQAYLGQAVPLEQSLRARYAGIMMDVAWALFEFRVHREGAASPNRIWTDITSRYLHIKPHPELSWWAMRGQLIENPGYLLNYAFGAIIAADLRAALVARYGSFTTGRRDWYGQVSADIYRFGLMKPAREVTEAILGRRPNPEALLADLGRIKSPGHQ